MEIPEILRRFIDQELDKQSVVDKKELTPSFRKVLCYYLSHRVPAYLRTKEKIKTELSEQMLSNNLHRFLEGYKEGRIGYTYKKEKNGVEVLSLREGDQITVLEKTSIHKKPKS